jgi:hypothetical protein
VHIYAHISSFCSAYNPSFNDYDVSITDHAVSTSSTSSFAVAPVTGKDKLCSPIHVSNDDSLSSDNAASTTSVLFSVA